MNENTSKMNKKALERLSSKQREKLETYIKAFIAKFPQVIVQSRCGEKKQKTSGKSNEKDVFELAIEENLDIQEKVQVACYGLNPLQEFCLCVETFLITADGDTLVLEAWNLRLSPSETYWDPKYRLYAELEIVIGNLMMLLKSIISVTRCTPAYKLSLGQSANTHVMLYRIYPGDPQVQQLGSNPIVNKIGEVYTPVGTISVTVACRSKSEMTVTPQSSGKENSFMVKSDYFNLDMSPKRTFSGARTIKKVLHNSTNSQNTGAFATCSILPDPNFPHLEFLQRNILHPSRSCLNRVQEKPVDNEKGDVNSNVSPSPPEPKTEGKLERDMVCERLSCSDVSDGSDFVLVDMKPPFANLDPDTDLNAFYHECQCAPSLSSFSNTPSLQEQVQDVASQLEKFEISMMDFDNFVDSVCQANAEI